jgi:hypothetical protein
MDRLPYNPEPIRRRSRPLPILDNGHCEPFKAAIHGLALGLCALMGAYNTAAWLRRRQRHLAINAVVYLSATIWEQRHVAHHVAACLAANESRTYAPVEDSFTDDEMKVA